MSKGGLTALYEALTEPLGPHLDDETLAEIATAETAGEDVDRTYTAQLRHLELCPECAGAYAALMETMSAAVTEMAEEADAFDPLGVYVTQLLQAARPQVGAVPELEALIQGAAVELATRFTRPPVSEEEAAAAIESAVRSAAQTIPAPPEVVTALREVIRDRLPALSTYLVRFARSVWGRVLEVKAEAVGAWQALQLTPAPRAAIPTLSSVSFGDEWLVLSQRFGHPLPVTIEVQATQPTELTCTIAVRVDRLGLTNVAGRPVQIAFGDRELEAVTDDQGVAHFQPVPIAALPQLTLRVRT